MPGFSKADVSVDLPGDFVESCAGLESDAILLAITYFSLLSAQESPSQVVDAFTLSDALPASMRQDPARQEAALNALLEAELLLEYTEPGKADTRYLLPGTPQGRNLHDQLARGEAGLSTLGTAQPLADQARPNIFKLYEANIGPLTPIMADILKQAEQDYPAEWIEKAVGEAVTHNARNWKYVQAILTSWKEKGRDEKNEKDRSGLEEFRKLFREQKNRP